MVAVTLGRRVVDLGTFGYIYRGRRGGGRFQLGLLLFLLLQSVLTVSDVAFQEVLDRRQYVRTAGMRFRTSRKVDQRVQVRGDRLLDGNESSRVLL